MSFVKTLVTLAVGFAAARGVSAYSKMGGMGGVQDAMRKAGEPGGYGDQLGQLAEKMGVPGGAAAVRDMMGKFGNQAADASVAGQAGLNNLVQAISAATAAGGKSMADIFGAATAGTPANTMAEENARVMIRAMIQAAKADGTIDAEERKKILDHLTDASPEEIAFVEAELDAPVDVQALAASVSDSMKAQVYAAARVAIRVDTPEENAYLNQLATALGLDAETRARLDSGTA